jgi:hypothetical protein
VSERLWQTDLCVAAGLELSFRGARLGVLRGAYQRAELRLARIGVEVDEHRYAAGCRHHVQRAANLCCRKNTPPFPSTFPCVCPEPVLVKTITLNALSHGIAKQMRFPHRGKSPCPWLRPPAQNATLFGVFPMSVPSLSW